MKNLINLSLAIFIVSCNNSPNLTVVNKQIDMPKVKIDNTQITRVYQSKDDKLVKIVEIGDKKDGATISFKIDNSPPTTLLANRMEKEIPLAPLAKVGQESPKFSAKANTNGILQKTILDIKEYEVYLVKSSQSSNYPLNGDPLNLTTGVVLGPFTVTNDSADSIIVNINGVAPSGADYYYTALKAKDYSSNNIIKVNNGSGTAWTGVTLSDHSGRVAVSSGTGIEVTSSYNVIPSTRLNLTPNLEDAKGATLEVNITPNNGITPLGIANNLTPIADDYQVNTYTTRNQKNSSVSTDANGNFVIAWQSQLGDGDEYGIYAQRYNSEGIKQIPAGCNAPTCDPATGEFLVNTYTTGYQSFPDIDMDLSGNFIITWRGGGNQDGSNYGVYAQRYNSAGIRQIPTTCTLPKCNPSTGEFRVNSYTTSIQESSKVNIDENGNFVIIWSSFTQDGSYFGLYAQKYNANGVPQIPSSCSLPRCNPSTGEFRINTYTTGSQFSPSIDSDSTGNFVVTWTSEGNQDGSDAGVYAQKYDSDGSTIGSEFRVNTYTTSFQRIPSMAMDFSGNFVITWLSGGQDGSSIGVYAQRYNSNAIKQIPAVCDVPTCDPSTGEFRINTYTNGSQSLPSVSMDLKGNFVVAWESGFFSSNQDGDNSGVYVQRYNSDGSPKGSEFRVNTYTTDIQRSPSVAMDSSGNLVVSWQSGRFTGSAGQDGDYYGVFKKQYSSNGSVKQ